MEKLTAFMDAGICTRLRLMVPVDVLFSSCFSFDCHILDYTVGRMILTSLGVSYGVFTLYAAYWLTTSIPVILLATCLTN
jgi:hypothetical protein